MLVLGLGISCRLGAQVLDLECQVLGLGLGLEAQVLVIASP